MDFFITIFNVNGHSAKSKSKFKQIPKQIFPQKKKAISLQEMGLQMCGFLNLYREIKPVILFYAVVNWMRLQG